MVADSTLQAIMTSGVAGSALVFASYALITSNMDKLQDYRTQRLDEIERQIKGIKPAKELEILVQDKKKFENEPVYLGESVYAIFVLYCASSLIALIQLVFPKENFDLGIWAVWCFGIATVLFGIIGICLLQDFLDFTTWCIAARKKVKSTKRGSNNG